VSAIARFKPAAIFLDYYYTFPHGEDPAREIAQFAQRLKDESEINGVPIRLGPVGDGPVFAPLRQIPSLGVSWTGLDLLSVPFAAADGSPIASYGLYRIWCQDRGIDCNWTPKGDLTLTWGFGVSDRALRFAAEEDAACALNSNSFAGKAVAGASHFTRAMFRAALYDEGGQSVRRDPLESRCFYNDTLIASHVMSGALDQEIAPLLENRIVLIGAAHARPADRHHIPQVGMVPGVYIHAMALDNLIEQGHDYVQQAPQIIYALDAADLVELVVTGLILLMAIQFRRAAARAPDHWRTPRLPLTIFLAGVALIAAAIVSMTLLHWPPINVLGVAALLSSLEFVFDSRERRARDGLS
jgi:CHASE2 domain-containing sensor protein